MQRYIFKGIQHFNISHVGSKAGSTTWLHHFVNQGSSRVQNFAKTFKDTQLHAKVPKLFSVEKLKFTELRFVQNCKRLRVHPQVSWLTPGVILVNNLILHHKNNFFFYL